MTQCREAMKWSLSSRLAACRSNVLRPVTMEKQSGSADASIRLSSNAFFSAAV